MDSIISGTTNQKLTVYECFTCLIFDRLNFRYKARKIICCWVISASILKPVLSKENLIEGGGDRISVHFAVMFLDC